MEISQAAPKLSKRPPPRGTPTRRYDSPMPSGRACAFCEKHGELTREHIFPDFLHKLRPLYSIGFNEAAGKVMKGAYTVADVCKGCNNGPLSQLDGGMKSWLARAAIPDDVRRDSKVEIHYDFHTLQRWLLKVSCNAARASLADERIFEPFRSYLLDPTRRPRIAEVVTLLELVRSYEVRERDRRLLPPELAGAAVLTPQMLRVGRASHRERPPPAGVVRFLAIDALHFFLVIAHGRDRSRDIDGALRSLRVSVPDAAILDPSASRMVLTASRRDFLEATQHHFLARMQAYVDYHGPDTVVDALARRPKE